MTDAATAAHAHRLNRDAAVRRFGQPAKTWGSVNEPRYREADGVTFNEMWVFKSPRDLDPDWVERIFYWYRYDLVASVRVNRDGRREREELTP
ncbi:MAG: hypothetical protein U0610_12885 [bacterium]